MSTPPTAAAPPLLAPPARKKKLIILAVLGLLTVGAGVLAPRFFASSEGSLFPGPGSRREPDSVPDFGGCHGQPRGGRLQRYCASRSFFAVELRTSEP